MRVVIHSRRTAIILRGEALRTWKAMDQKNEHTERTTAVTLGEMRVIAVYQPVCNDGGAPVELYRREVEHKMTMCPRKTTLIKGRDHNSQVGGAPQRDGVSGKFGLRTATNEAGKDILQYGVKQTIRP